MLWSEGIEGKALDIAKSNDKRLRVMAGPGTGKTFALMRKIARLLEEGVEPNKILLVTFTRTAAFDLKRELDKLGLPGIDKIKAGTLHSRCFSILNQEAILKITDRNPRPLLDYEKKFLIEDLKYLKLGNSKFLNETLKGFEASWARLQSDEPGWPRDSKDRHFHQALINWLKFHDAMLIGELVPTTLTFLRDNPTCEEIEKYRYIFVDEYQDLNKAEQALINLLSEESSVMIIGDEDQSIYRFRYAHPEGIVSYKDEHPDTNDISLEQCRRCPKKVVNIANSLIQNNELRFKQNVLKVRNENEEGEIHVIQWETMDEEIEGLADFIKKKIKEDNFDPGKILVLSPRRLIGYKIKDRLRDINIDSHSFFTEEALEGNPKISGKSQIQEAFTLLILLANSEDKVALRCWLGFGHNSLRASDYKRIRDYCNTNNISIKNLLEKLCLEEIRISNTNKLIERYKKLKNRLEELSELKGLALFEKLFPESEEWAKTIREFSNNIKETQEPSDMLEELRTNITQPELPTDIDYVRIMSLHKSKGLTADLVVICSCIDGLIPRRSQALLEDELKKEQEEQRRLFYVGITRTKDTLIISNFKNIEQRIAYKIGAKVVSRTSMTTTIASPFIHELGPSLQRTIRGRDWRY